MQLTGIFFSNGVDWKCLSMLEAPFKNLQSNLKKAEYQLDLLRRFLLDLETVTTFEKKRECN